MKGGGGLREFRIVFLGTGGGRFATITQERQTAGIRLLADGFNVHLDPGPGALVHSWNLGLDPRRLDGVLVSHAHPDHYTDAEILVEAMTGGALKRRGVLAASKSVLGGENVAISKYHQSLPSDVVEVFAGTQFKVSRVKVTGCEARHLDVTGVGFRFETEFGDLAYTSDTGFFDEIGGWYQGVRVLILCVLRPGGERWRGHLSTSEAVKVVKRVRPEFVILTHFGMKMIQRGPAEEARRTKNLTGVETVAAWDGMVVSVMESGIRLGKAVEGKRTTR
ncbi:MAG: MBL fold metallo-hydrolase [Candidatus Bathyarchaeota archaeon]|nr:MBL fold metallo-hydrolase [Candidatus Bathyarchaeota archaeon]